MSRNSIAQSLVAWENALANVKTNAPDLPNLGVYTAALEKVLADAKDLSAQLDGQKGKKQQLAKDRQALMKAGTAAVARLRSALKAHYGLDSERLIDYGARPVRPRTRRSPLEKTPPPQVTSPAGGSGAEIQKPETKAQ
jgi:hypothetical protein